jgi:hypothetical protein
MLYSRAASNHTMSNSSTLKMNTNTVCIHDGPSPVDGARVVVLLSGLTDPSINTKTGDMIQTYIVRADMAPDIAAASGADASICGKCNFRPVAVAMAAQDNLDWVPCYVDKIRGPAGAWKSWKAGRVESISPAEASARIDKLQRCPGPCKADCKLAHIHAALDGNYGFKAYPKSGHARSTCAKSGHASGKLGTRDGSYGDPANVPFNIWLELHVKGTKRTSYTHAWETSPEMASISMASIDGQTWADVDVALDKAHAMGFRTYRVLGEGEEPRADEFLCPESPEGSNVTCATCGACNGCPDTPTGRPNNMKSVAIPAIT